MDTPLHRFAAAHDGIVTVRAARALGYDWARLRAVIRAEGWTRIAPSAYAMPDPPVALRARVRAEQLRHGAVVASHRTAAALHGADVLRPAFELTASGPTRFDIPEGTHYRWALDRDDVVLLDGLAVTSPARTATDLLRALPQHEAVIVTDGLLRAGTVTLDAVADRLDRLAGRRFVKSRAWPSFARLDPRAESVAESKARLVLHDARLYPRSQVVVADRGGRRVRVDLWFPSGVAVEVEGFAFHATRDQHQADIARFNAIARVAGATVLRFSWADVFHRPASVVATVRAALARAAGDSGPVARGDW